MSEEPIFAWHSATTKDSGHVTGLTPILDGLRGQLPDLSDLSRVTFLLPGGNLLTAALPDLSAFPNLAYLQVSGNQLHEQVTDLSTLTGLTFLELGYLPSHVQCLFCPALYSCGHSGDLTTCSVGGEARLVERHCWNAHTRSVSDGFGGGRCGGAAPAQGRAEGVTAVVSGQWSVVSGQ